jgi:hypothetical protein
MADAVTKTRKQGPKLARQLERFCRGLWAMEGRLTAAAEFGANAEAERLAGLLGCVLVDHLQPALATLKQLALPESLQDPKHREAPEASASHSTFS